jgi:hypothetical protein
VRPRPFARRRDGPLRTRHDRGVVILFRASRPWDERLVWDVGADNAVAASVNGGRFFALRALCVVASRLGRSIAVRQFVKELPAGFSTPSRSPHARARHLFAALASAHLFARAALVGGGRCAMLGKFFYNAPAMRDVRQATEAGSRTEPPMRGHRQESATDKPALPLCLVFSLLFNEGKRRSCSREVLTSTARG